jgi:alkylation response protein AidB-like acyl-CoA dehydrogenase
MIARNDKELTMLKKATNEFSRKILFPDREENDKFPFGPFFDSVLEKAYSVDFFHTLIPETLGGIGQGVPALSVILESVCTEDSSLGGIIFTTAAALNLMITAGRTTEIQAMTDQKTIKDMLIACPVFCNPSDISDLPEAKKSGDGYVLTGSLDYLTLGGLAKTALIPARISGSPGYSYFLMDLGSSTVIKSKPVLSLGLRACPSVDITMKSVPAILVGEEGNGGSYFKTMSDRMHVAAAAMSLGIMKGSFREAFEYSKKRIQGGQAIINWSELKMILSNMAIQVKVAEMLVTRACSALDSQQAGWMDSARAAALHVQSLACDLTTDGVQALGGVGYMKDFGQEKRFRDAKQIQALLGSSPVKRLRFLDEMVERI